MARCNVETHASVVDGLRCGRLRGGIRDIIGLVASARNGQYYLVHKRFRILIGRKMGK